MTLFLIEDIMEQLGVSVLDMAIAFAFSILILILMLIFIFVGIAAFSPLTSFSSVTNSILPLGAGIFVNKKQTDKSDEDDENVADKASEVMT
jgi:hypothetical protein